VARDSRDRRNAPGFAHRRLGPDDTANLMRSKPAGTTLNDLVLAATAMTVSRWNAAHGKRTDRVQLYVPVSIRPTRWSADVVSNLFSYISVNIAAADRTDLHAAAEAVHRQTEPYRRTVRAGGTHDLLRLVAPLPLGIKRAMPHLLTLTGGRFVDSAVVSNLGKPEQMPTFDDGPPPATYFTPPYWSAAAVSVGIISNAGCLHLGVRHRLNTLDGDAGNRFADLLISCLTGS
jgi:NRPS condensation-like uncharacterized protein